VKPWLKRWFNPRERVDARTYLQVGTLLVLLKYGTDALLVWAATGRFWRPTGYLNPVVSLRGAELADAPAWLFWALILWSIPFLYIGASMTLRRAVDAGYSPWSAVLFFIPYLNYAVMLALAAIPSDTDQAAPIEAPTIEPVKAADALLAMFAGLAIVLPSVVFGALIYRRYTPGLFLGTPFILGLVTGFLFNRRHLHTHRATLWTVFGALAVAGVALMAFALEGAVCIVMTLPLAFLIALPGAGLGREIAVRGAEDLAKAGALAVLAPLLAVVVPPGRAPLYEVSSAVIVAAPPETVWRHVVSFGPLTERPTGIFRLGIAYPVAATITGAGVGAVRRCEFSTGAFVEPITVWDAPRRLAFDVDSAPAPLRELSPYTGVSAPHVNGYLRSRRGEFRLISLPGGRTRLEGSTWYELDVHPAPYWRWWSDAVITRIHLRVLRHVKSLAEEEQKREP